MLFFMHKQRRFMVEQMSCAYAATVLAPHSLEVIPNGEKHSGNLKITYKLPQDGVTSEEDQEHRDNLSKAMGAFGYKGDGVFSSRLTHQGVLYTDFLVPTDALDISDLQAKITMLGNAGIKGLSFVETAIRPVASNLAV
jgi:hypothetical protein